MVRVILPQHLRALARVEGELSLEVVEPVTQRSVLDALEARFPMLRGPSATMRPSGDGRSSGSLPANRISPTRRTIDRCPMPWPRAGAAVDRRRHGRRVSRLLKRVASGGCRRDSQCDVSQRRPMMKFMILVKATKNSKRV